MSKMSEIWKRSLSFVLALVMVVGMVPTQAFAEETEQTGISSVEATTEAITEATEEAETEAVEESTEETEATEAAEETEAAAETEWLKPPPLLKK